MKKYPTEMYCPKGKLNSDKYEKLIYGYFSTKDTTWSKVKKIHTCCKSSRASRHKAGCTERVRNSSDDLSDLRDL